MYRNTYLQINVKNIENNVKTLIKNKNNYKYYIGVVKADFYNHGIGVLDSIIKGGCNYLAVATLDEALEIRNKNKDIPILCLGIIPIKYIKIAHENNITVTISNLKYLDDLLKYSYKLNVHIKINTGMNRLGVSSKKEFNEVYKKVINSCLNLEGIYSHIYDSCNEKNTLNQFKLFENITSDIDLNTIKIIHITASDSTIIYKKKSYINGCRLGLSIYGITSSNLKLLPTFKLVSEVIQINSVSGSTVGYDGKYKVKDKELIAVVPIGYADGIIRKNTKRYVYINNKKYTIVGNICMDMLFIKVDENVKVNDQVVLIKDNKDIKRIASYLDTIAYEVICSINKRVPRKYIN